MASRLGPPGILIWAGRDREHDSARPTSGSRQTGFNQVGPAGMLEGSAQPSRDEFGPAEIPPKLATAHPGGVCLGPAELSRFGPAGLLQIWPRDTWVRVVFQPFFYYLFNSLLISFIYTTTPQHWDTGVTSPTLVPEAAGDSQSRAQTYKDEWQY